MQTHKSFTPRVFARLEAPGCPCHLQEFIKRDQTTHPPATRLLCLGCVQFLCFLRIVYSMLYEHILTLINTRYVTAKHIIATYGGEAMQEKILHGSYAGKVRTQLLSKHAPLLVKYGTMPKVTDDCRVFLSTIRNTTHWLVGRSLCHRISCESFTCQNSYPPEPEALEVLVLSQSLHGATPNLWLQVPLNHRSSTAASNMYTDPLLTQYMCVSPSHHGNARSRAWHHQ